MKLLTNPIFLKMAIVLAASGFAFFTAAIVMRSQLVRPGTIVSGRIAPVAVTVVVTLPAAVDTRSWLAISRVVLSSSRRIRMLGGRSSWPAKPIWIHCLTGDHSSPSAQAVAGLPSKALAGSSCWVSAIQET